VNAALAADGSGDTTALRHQAQKLAGTASFFGDIRVETAGYQLDHFLKDHPRNQDTKGFLSFAQRFKEALDQSKYI